MNTDPTPVSSRSCPVCRECAPIRFGDRDGVTFVRCAGCGSLYHAAPPDGSRIAELYQNEYHARRGHSADPAIERVKQLSAGAFLRLLGRHRPRGRRLLEIGCSTGAALEEAARVGWQADGVEVSKSAAEIARRRPGVRQVFEGPLEKAGIPPAAYDAVVLLDVIEHIDPPDETIRCIQRALSLGGLLLIVTPDAGSLSAGVMKTRWPHLFMEHVVLYTRRSMQRLLEQTGFAVLQAGFAWKRVTLDMLVRHATIHPHVAGGGVLRLLGRGVPAAMRRAAIPFNIGEFFMIAQKPVSQANSAISDLE